MNRSIRRLSVAAVVSALVLTACGRGGDDDNAGGDGEGDGDGFFITGGDDTPTSFASHKSAGGRPSWGSTGGT